MTQPRIALATLCLNEDEWLLSNYLQHKDWPGLCAWIFVEGADYVYKCANPSMVSPAGLSVDNTTRLLADIANRDDRVRNIPFGVAGNQFTAVAQNKCILRNAYLSALERLAASEGAPDYLIVIDADEFWPHSSQAMVASVADTFPNHTAFDFRRREIWRPPSSRSGLFDMEVRGGYWDIPHTRVWRWQPGLSYSEHNTPGQLHRRLVQLHNCSIEYCHLGFASMRGRAAKHRYYESRGEGRTDHRGWYVECRRAWETWERGDPLPHGARVIKYDGPVPEIFQESSK